jgi:hypothetical protein
MLSRQDNEDDVLGPESGENMESVFREEKEPEESMDWSSFMEVQTLSNDFYPFPSKLFALLFILLHSP